MPRRDSRAEAPGAAAGPARGPSLYGHRQPLKRPEPAPPPPAPRAAPLAPAGPRASAAMNPSPLKTALAYECFQDQDNSTLALPSDQKMKTGTSGRQRVQEQVMMTVKRQKSKSSQSSTLSHSNRGKRSVRPAPERRGRRRPPRGARPGAAGR